MAKLRTGGFGRQGYCKLCSFDDVDLQREFDRRVGKNWTPAKLNEWLGEHEIKPVSRDTIYSHRKHIQNPKDRMVSAVQKRTAEQGFLPAKVSEDEFLETVVQLGQKRAMEDPDSVSIDHALKAAQIRSTMKRSGQDLQVLIQLVAGAQEPVIEGEAREV